MKIVKFFLRVLVLAIVVFLTTGLLVKETTYQMSVSIDKPLDEVFAAFNDTSQLKTWMPEIQSIETLEYRLGIVGNKYKLLIVNESDTIEMNEKILAYIPNDKVTLYFEGDNMLKTEDYNFSERNGVTTITKNVVCNSDSYLMQCMFPYFKGVFLDMDQQHLNNFKVYIEK